MKILGTLAIILTIPVCVCAFLGRAIFDAARVGWMLGEISTDMAVDKDTKLVREWKARQS